MWQHYLTACIPISIWRRLAMSIICTWIRGTVTLLGLLVTAGLFTKLQYRHLLFCYDFIFFSYILTICIIVFAHLCLLLRPGREVEYCNQLVCLSVRVCVCVCLSASISLKPLDRNFLCRSPVAIAQSSSGSVAICCVLPVLWMTPRLALVWRCMQGWLSTYYR